MATLKQIDYDNSRVKVTLDEAYQLLVPTLEFNQSLGNLSGKENAGYDPSELPKVLEEYHQQQRVLKFTYLEHESKAKFLSNITAEPPLTVSESMMEDISKETTDKKAKVTELKQQVAALQTQIGSQSAECFKKIEHLRKVTSNNETLIKEANELLQAMDNFVDILPDEYKHHTVYELQNVLTKTTHDATNTNSQIHTLNEQNAVTRQHLAAIDIESLEKSLAEKHAASHTETEEKCQQLVSMISSWKTEYTDIANLRLLNDGVAFSLSGNEYVVRLVHDRVMVEKNGALVPTKCNRAPVEQRLFECINELM